MGMVIYELKKELISESRVENSKIDGDFETISSPLASREAQGAISKSEKRQV